MNAHRILSSLSALALVAASACATETEGAVDEQSAALLERPQLPFAPRVALDFNPDPDIVEVNLIAQESWVRLGNGGWTRAYTYNGTIPGPTIQAKVGDRLIVHFLNLLPEETTVHWHGVDLPATMDGSMIAQAPVAPGDTFTYEFDLLAASTYWFHPHIRGNVQVERGLYAALVVSDPEEDETLITPEKEYVAMLDDILLDDDGQIAEPLPEDPAERASMLVNGREGNVLLVNGESVPTLHVRSGEPVRLRFVNASNSTFQRLSFPSDNAYRIGGDQGLLEAPLPIAQIDQVPTPMMDMDMDDPCMEMGGMMMMPETISNPDPEVGLLLTPGERADVVFTPRGERGEEQYVMWHDLARGRHEACVVNGNVMLGHDHMDGKMPPKPLFKLKFSRRRELAGNDYEPPAVLRDIAAIDATGAAPLPVRFGHMPPMPNGDVMFFATMKDGMGVPFPMVTSDEALKATVGETRVWEVANMTMGDHPFHIHGFTFQHLETRYMDMDTPENNFVVPAPRLENKDTIRVPRRLGEKGRSMTIARLAVTFDDTGREGQVAASGKMPTDDTSGGWLFHCHVLEHSASGMASFLEVSYPED